MGGEFVSIPSAGYLPLVRSQQSIFDLFIEVGIDIEQYLSSLL